MRKPNIWRAAPPTAFWIGILVFLDQWTKGLALTAFKNARLPHAVTWFFNIVYTENAGISFGLLQNVRLGGINPLLIFIPAVMLILLIWWARSQDPAERFGLMLVLSGALGNFWDRFSKNYVIDFIDVHWGSIHFPAFNLADSWITLGVLVMLYGMVRQARRPVG